MFFALTSNQSTEMPFAVNNERWNTDNYRDSVNSLSVTGREIRNTCGT